ncbi:MAG: cytochrome oxidase assembly protein [Deltaproteobacteria bacterium]|nr:cytochrome oxidase assembly protein [Deltaproteobacteria bacterium]MBM4298407.1 cytochrome oxidase assembly protein [Deltaproteobacteria bacterium]
MKAESGKGGHAVLSQSFSPWPHRLAVVLSCATLPLLFIGGLVTSLGVGLAVPDWPTTFGYNMFLYPWSKMIGGIFYEHSHRLVASCVGLLTIVLAVTLWLKESRNWLRWLGIFALGLVIFQGVLGGLRVVLLRDTLAIVHACFAQAFFALTVCLAVFTSAEWRTEMKNPLVVDGGKLRRLAAITTGLIYVQVIFGALLRHTGERLDGHLLFAALVAVHVVLLLLRVLRAHAEQKTLARPAVWLAILLGLQVILGTVSYLAKFTVALRWPFEAIVILTTSHLVVGALMLATSVVLTLRAYRYSRGATAAVGRRQVLSEQLPA